MKKTILCMAIIFAYLAANSQISFTANAGYNSRKCLNAGAYIQYNLSNFFIAVGFDGLFSQKVETGDLYYSRIGYSITLNEDYSFEPSLGWGSDYKGAQNKDLNKQGMFGSFYIVKKLSRDNASLIGGVTFMNKLVLSNVGIRCNFIRNAGKRGCPSSW